LHAQEVTNILQDNTIIMRNNTKLLQTQADLILSLSSALNQGSIGAEDVLHQEIMMNVVKTNMKVYSMIMEMQKMMVMLPPQIDRQQPVYFEDAHGRIAPFFTEFISSREVFLFNC
jgi:hypothetical protein